MLANSDTLVSLPTEVVDSLLRSDTSKAQEYSQGLLFAADVGYKTVLRRRPVPLTDGPPDDDYIICFNIGSLKSTRLCIDAVYRKIVELANLLAESDIPKSPDGSVRLQTLQSYDGRNVPGNFNPTTQNVVATNKFSVLSYGNLRSMSKDVLEHSLSSTLRPLAKAADSSTPPMVLLHLLKAAQSKNTRSVLHQPLRLPPVKALSHLPPSLLHSMELTFARTVCSSLKRYGINPKTRSRNGYAIKLHPLLRTHPFVGHRPILSFWWISPAHGAHIRGY